ncbi:MAG: 50S ribosomal protein L5 [Solirubrobacterales bacterium]|nr:50S ribosomal protein L5 [Solirubrobacterales bacterium]
MEATASTTQQAVPPPRLRETYQQEVLPSLIEKFGYSSPMRAPRLEKITLNMGLGSHMDTRSREKATGELALIAGQAPNVRVAKKSIASFKVREGMPVGCAVTLRGARMWEFLDRLCSIAIPRIRDFRGLKANSFDGRGNYSMGVKEQLIFPEIDYDSVDEAHGIDITITTSAPTDYEAFELLLALGMPFAQEGRPMAEGSAEAAAAEAAEAKAAEEAEAAKREEAARQAEAAEQLAAEQAEQAGDEEQGEEAEAAEAEGDDENTDTEAQEG